MTKNSKHSARDFTLGQLSLHSGIISRFAQVGVLLAIILLGISITSCGFYIGTGGPSTSPTLPPAPTSPPASTAVSNGDTSSCTGYGVTGGGITKTFPSITVSNGCVMIVDAYAGQGIGSNSCTEGCVAAFGPGVYRLTLTSGEYQIISAANGNQLYCTKVTQLQQNNQVDNNNYPMSGWSC